MQYKSYWEHPPKRCKTCKSKFLTLDQVIAQVKMENFSHIGLGTPESVYGRRDHIRGWGWYHITVVFPQQFREDAKIRISFDTDGYERIEVHGIDQEKGKKSRYRKFGVGE